MNFKHAPRPEFTAWSADNPRMVTVWLDTVSAYWVPYDDIEGFALAYTLDSPYGVGGEIQVWTPNGVVEAKPGEWIVYVGVIGELGEGRNTYVVMPDDVFRAEFRAVDSDARLLLEAVQAAAGITGAGQEGGEGNE